MMIKKQMLLWMVCLSLLLVQLPAVSAAAGLPDGRMTYETPFTDTDHSLTGSGSRQQNFTIMDYWNVDELKINLHYQVSQIIEERDSSVTLLLNGSPFYSFRPSLKNNGVQRISINAPKKNLRKGSNTLSIQGHLRTEDAGNQVCYVDNRQGSWLQLSDTSSIAVKYTQKPLSGGLSDFSDRFTGIDTVNGNKSLIAVPENARGSELEAATYALSGMVKGNTLSGRTIPLLPYRADTVKDRSAVVVVAMYDRLPAGLKSLLSPSGDLATHAVIQLVRKESQPTLVVTSKDESLLIKAGRLLASRELMGQINRDVKVVDDATEVADPAFTLNSNIVLSEAGDKLTGPNHQVQTYFIPLPANRSIADSGKISLDFRYAQNLDFDRSLVTVSINNMPIGSKKLTKELANGDTLDLSVPQSLNISGNFSVSVAFDLELANAVCTPNTEQMPWAYISKESSMHLNTKDRTELLFDNYPYPFLRDGIYNHVAVVLPREMDDYSYLTLGNVFNLLGQYAGGNTGDIHYYKDDVSSDNLKNNNIIVIGSFQTNKVIRDNNSKLYFRYNPEGSAFLTNEKISIEEGYGSQLGTLQLVNSPYADANGLLVLTGVHPEDYYLASKLISSGKDRWRIYGDGVFSDKDGNVGAYRFKAVTGAGKDSVVQQIMDRGDVLGFVVAVVLVIVLVLVALLLLLRKHYRNRGDQREA